jgi:hypothetical protein
VYAHIPGKRNGRRSDSSRQIGRIKRGMTYLGGAPVAVVAPDGLSVAAAVEGASVIPSLSGHGGRRGEETHDSEGEREKKEPTSTKRGFIPQTCFLPVF